MNKIKELRTIQNMKQIELANILKTTQANISAWESDKWQPSNNDLIKLSEIFNCSTDYLLGRTSCTKPNYYPADLNLADNEMLIIGNGGEKKIVKLNEMQKKIFDTIIEDADKNKN